MSTVLGQLLILILFLVYFVISINIYTLEGFHDPTVTAVQMAYIVIRGGGFQAAVGTPTLWICDAS